MKARINRSHSRWTGALSPYLPCGLVRGCCLALHVPPSLSQSFFLDAWNTVSPRRVPPFGNAVDLWTFGKLSVIHGPRCWANSQPVTAMLPSGSFPATVRSSNFMPNCLALEVCGTRGSQNSPHEPYPTKAGSDYGKTLWRAVVRGQVTYREILTMSWAGQARKLLGEASRDKGHVFSVIAYDLPSFNNFIVMVDAGRIERDVSRMGCFEKARNRTAVLPFQESGCLRLFHCVA